VLSERRCSKLPACAFGKEQAFRIKRGWLPLRTTSESGDRGQRRYCTDREATVGRSSGHIPRKRLQYRYRTERYSGILRPSGGRCPAAVRPSVVHVTSRPGGSSGLQDQVRHLLGMADQREVAGVDLDGRSIHSLGEETLELR
jgi:hypothetical protein